MEDYAGRVLADRYRLPLPPSDEYELTDTRAFDTYSGQEVLVRQVPLPEVVEAEVLDAEGLPEGFTARESGARRASGARGATRTPSDPAVRRAVEAAQAAARIPDHPRLDQVFDVFAEGGSLWIVSEAVAGRPLSALLAGETLNPYRAAEVASDVLMALRVLHAHGWVHRNITSRTVLVCDDGRVMLTGLAVGAAEEALCGYDPVPGHERAEAAGPGADTGARGPAGQGMYGDHIAVRQRGVPVPPGVSGPPAAAGPPAVPGPAAPADGDPEAARRAAIQARAAGGLPAPAAEPAPARPAVPGTPGPRAVPASGNDIRAARAGAIAAYRAGAQAAARVQETRQGERAALPGARTPEGGPAGPEGAGNGAGPYDDGPGRVADPYGVNGAPWHGASPRDGGRGGAGSPGAPPGSAPGDQRPSALAGGTARLPLPGRTPGPDDPYGAPWPSGGTAPTPVPPYGTASGPSLPDQRGAGLPGRDRRAGAGPALPAQPGAPAQPLPPTQPGAPRWDERPAGRRGPGSALAAERARQVRMTVVGPVTERWAPEQAGSVHENWQLAAPVGPATDLWALGALLFRAVQGHAPYPEDSTAELVQLVCAEPPAFAEECGALRPVVESLLRQDPTERPDVEELNGWLRSLVRSAPEPDAGVHVVPVPPADPKRLPIIRRRGELVRRRRAGVPARHKRAVEEPGSPRRLGRLLLVLIFLLLAGAVAYAVLFMPRQGEDGGSTGAAPPATSATPSATTAPSSGRSADSGGAPSKDASTPADGNGTGTDGGSKAADGFTLRTDPAGFRIAVANGWDRAPKNGSGQVVYSHGNFELIVVPGRDSASAGGGDPMAYQRDRERELQPYRDTSWATATGLRTTEVGGRVMAEGQFTWTDGLGRDLYVRNMALLLNGRYHVVQVRGPEAERDEITRLYEQATSSYRFTG